MPREPRFIDKNITYHCMSQCIENKPLLKPVTCKLMMLQIFRKTLKKYEFEIISYQIMDTHFHITIKTLNNDHTISRIMQYIKARFAETYNRKHNRTGPFWNGRFKSKVIEHSSRPEEYLPTHLWYQGYNPVKAGIVKDPRDYRFSSIRSYLEKDYSSPVKITHHDIFLKMGKTFPERVKVFLRYEEIYRKKYNNIMRL